MNIYISGDTDPTLTAELTYLIEWLENRLNFPPCGGVDLDLTIDPDCDADGYTAGDGELIVMELLSTDLTKMVHTLFPSHDQAKTKHS